MALAEINLDAVAQELRDKRSDLPHGIKIIVDRKTRNLLVGNDELGFCITREAVRDGLYREMFEPALDHLVWILDKGLHKHQPEMFTLEQKNG